MRIQTLLGRLAILLGATMTGGALHAAQFFSDFNSGTVPPGSQTFVNAIIDGGALKLTVAANSQGGIYYINDLADGNPVTNFVVSYKVLIGGGTARPADGMSFSFASDLPAAPGYGNPGEEGGGTGIIVGFDSWDNNGVDTAPSIDLKVGGTAEPGNVVAYQSLAGEREGGRAPSGPLYLDDNGVPVALSTGAEWADVRIELFPDNTVTVMYKGFTMINRVAVPGYVPVAGGKFAFGARTGGANDNHWIDNLMIAANFTPGPARVTSHPASLTVPESLTATFQVQVDGTPLIAYQWYSNNVAIAGANNPAYTTPAANLGMNGARYKCVVSNGEGSETSDEAVLTVDASPIVLSVASRGKPDSIWVRFNKPVVINDGSGAGYVLDGGSSVVNQAYGVDNTEVKLTVNPPMMADTPHSLAVDGVAAVGGGSVIPATVAFWHGLGRACFDFNDGAVPAGTATYGNATVVDGVMQLTIAANGQSGTFLVGDRLSGNPLDRIYIKYRAYIGGGTVPPADGMSVNIAPDLPAGTLGEAEEGTGAGLTVAFDNWDSGGGEAPAIDVKWKGVTVGHQNISITRTGFVDVAISMDPDGTVDVSYDGRDIYYNLPTPFRSLTGAKVGFYARTGGANENHWIDNVCINDFNLGPAVVSQEPDDVSAPLGSLARFAVVADGTPPFRYQWYRDNELIPGATRDFYVTPPVTAGDEGALFHCVVANECGEAVSAEAQITIPPNPRVVSVSSRDKLDHIYVTFDRPVVLDVGSTGYSLSPIAVDEQEYDGDNHNVVVLTTGDPLLADVTYTLAVSGLVGENGAEVVPSSHVFRIGFGRFCSDFSTAPAEGTVYGSAQVLDGSVQLTTAINGVLGSYLVQDLNGGFPLDRFEVRFKARVGGGTAPPADGYSLSFANDLPNAVFGSEEGAGSGLIVAFDIYDNADGDPNNGTGEAPSIDIKWNGAVVRETRVPLSLIDSGAGFKDVYLAMTPDGKLTLIYGGVMIYDNLQTPFVPKPGARFGFSGRTGGLNVNQWIDDLCINDFAFTAPTFRSEPLDVTITENPRATATFSVDPDGLAPYSYQWYSNNVAIAGANNRQYTTPPLDRQADGALYHCVVTNACGMNVTRDAVVTIVRDTAAPVALSAVARCIFASQTNIVVFFSEALDAASATDVANYVLDSGFTVQSASLTPAQIVPNGRMVELHVTPALGQFDCVGLTISNVRDAIGYNTVAETRLPVTVRTPVLGSGANNLIVWEAEDVDNIRNDPTRVAVWQVNNVLPGASGGAYLDAMPNLGTGGGDTFPAVYDRQRADYCINFPVAGRYYLWARGSTANDGGNNSFHFGIDGVSPDEFTRRVGNRVNNWGGDAGNVDAFGWVNDVNGTGAGSVAYVDVATPGPHIINIWMREDGIKIDKLLFTTDAAFTLAAADAGPAVTGRSSTQPRLASSMTTDGSRIVTLSWPGTGWLLQASTALDSVPANTQWLDLPFTSPVVIPPAVFPTATNVTFRLIWR